MSDQLTPEQIQARIDRLESIIKSILAINLMSDFSEGIVDTDISDNHFYQSGKLRSVLDEAREYLKERDQ